MSSYTKVEEDTSKAGTNGKEKKGLKFGRQIGFKCVVFQEKPCLHPAAQQHRRYPGDVERHVEAEYHNTGMHHTHCTTSGAEKIKIKMEKIGFAEITKLLPASKY